MESILEAFMGVIDNFGVAIILFTIVVKIFLIPLIYKQQKSMMNMQKIQPFLKELQEKYKHDKEKLNMETMKLYKEHRINPMASCLPMLIQMPILFSMWFVIRRVTENPYLLETVNFNFLGLNLSEIPNWGPALMTPSPNVLWVIPIVAGLTTYLSSRAIQKFAQAPMATPDGKNPMKMMMLFFPFFTVWIAFTFPAGVGLYWIVTNFLQTGQQYGVHKFLQRKSNSETEVDVIHVKQNRKGRKKR